MLGTRFLRMVRRGAEWARWGKRKGSRLLQVAEADGKSTIFCLWHLFGRLHKVLSLAYGRFLPVWAPSQMSNQVSMFPNVPDKFSWSVSAVVLIHLRYVSKWGWRLVYQMLWALLSTDLIESTLTMKTVTPCLVCKNTVPIPSIRCKSINIHSSDQINAQPRSPPITQSHPP